MKYKFPLFLSLFAFLAACASTHDASNKTERAKTGGTYDAALAAELGADDYGMRQYVFVVLKTGPNDANIVDKDQRSELFKGHFGNMERLAEDGKLVLAGPFMDGGDKGTKRGLYIFDVRTVDEAKALTATDPAVQAGIFVAEYTPYYGSAALKKIQEMHKSLQKSPIE